MIAMLVGGLAIVLGYRLFVAVPAPAAASSAELARSDDRRLIVTRLGPAVFFALFGAAIVTASFYSAVAGTSANGTRYAGVGGRPPAIIEGPAVRAMPAIDRSEALAALRFLEATAAEPPLAADQATADSRKAKLRDAQVVILHAIWEPSWGDPVEFSYWVQEAPPRTRRPEFERALSVIETGELH